MTEPDLLLEICVDCLESIRNAIEGGADRLELCSALSEGGLTPSIGLVKLAKRVSSIPIFAMIRIRGGNFVYEPEEIDAMLEDVKSFKSIGVDGLVFGALTPADRVDAPVCKRLVQAASPLPVTFHRAFDDAEEPFAALDEIRELGFARILTSGQCKSALDGAELIAKLIERAGDEVVVVAGAGINENNIASVRDATGAREFHGSAKRTRLDYGKSRMDGCPVTVADMDVVIQMALSLKKAT